MAYCRSASLHYLALDARLSEMPTSFNHVSVHARDLDQSAAFYELLFGMRGMATPRFAFPVRWLRLGSQQLHLFVRPGVAAPPFHHFALNVDDFETVYWTACRQGLLDGDAFSSALYELPDGSAQMYVRDPADNLVEIDWPEARTLHPRIRADLTSLSAEVPQDASGLGATLFHAGASQALLDAPLGVEESGS